MTTPSPAPAPRLGRRNRGEPGPRARLVDLLPYLREHRRVLAVVVGLSLVGAVTSLVQPLLVQPVVQRVQRGRARADLVTLIAVLVAASALLSAVQHYLLQRTGTSVVLSA